MIFTVIFEFLMVYNSSIMKRCLQSKVAEAILIDFSRSLAKIWNARKEILFRSSSSHVCLFVLLVHDELLFQVSSSFSHCITWRMEKSWKLHKTWFPEEMMNLSSVLILCLQIFTSFLPFSLAPRCLSIFPVLSSEFVYFL